MNHQVSFPLSVYFLCPYLFLFPGWIEHLPQVMKPTALFTSDLGTRACATAMPAVSVEPIPTPKRIVYP